MPLLEVKELSIQLDNQPIVKQVNFELGRGECVGLVGESGCGKSLTAQALIYPFGQVQGEILLEGIDLLKQPEAKMLQLRRQALGMIYQEPLTALNPLLTIGRQLTEGGRATPAQALSFLKRVGIPEPERRFKQYPHELSGGQRQRVLLAMALVTNPKLLIADEPTTALDVSLQVEICQLLKDFQKEGLTILFISHDLGVVKQLCQRVMVMQAGQIVETAPTDQLFKAPSHPYTKQLLQWRPRAC